MIDGIKLIPLTTHLDERGFFREVLRVSDIEQFGQWSHSAMYQDTIKAFHIHATQTDFWYLATGVVKAVLADLRNEPNLIQQSFSGDIRDWQVSSYFECQEFILGDNQPPLVLVIPPGVAHGLKVLQGPAHLFYITSQVYNPKDEGRIPYDALGYDWFNQDIK